MARHWIMLVALLVLLPACRQQRQESEAAVMAKAVAEDAAHQQELARDEQKFVATLKKAKALAERGAPVVLYEVSNPLDSNYEPLRNRELVARYPINRTIHLPSPTALELSGKLTDRRSYFPPGQIWTCLFEPHHALVIGTGAERVTAIVSVKCGDVDFIVGDQSIGVHSVTPAANRSLIELLEGRTSENRGLTSR